MALVLISACREQAPPAPTAEQAGQLNEMDDSLNALAQNEEGPSTNGQANNGLDQSALSR